MKKRIIAIVIAALLLLSAAACGSGQGQADESSSGEQTSQSAVSTTAQGVPGQDIGINLVITDGMYTVTMPVSYISFGELTPEEYSEQNGYESITLDEMGENYLISMSEQKHTQCLNEIKESFDKECETYKQANSFAEDISSQDNYAKIVITVNRQEYASSGGNTSGVAITLGTYGSLYRAYAGFEPVTVVDTVYSDTQETAQSIRIPSYT